MHSLSCGIVAVYAVISLTACHGRHGNTAETDGDTLAYAYSTLLTTVCHDTYTETQIADPWNKGHVLQRYWLVDRKDSAKVGRAPEGVTKVIVPLRRAVLSTSSVCYLLLTLGGADGVKGVCDSKYVKGMPYYRDKLSRGVIADCGDGMSPSVEKISDMEADAVFLSAYQGSDFSRLARLHMPLIYCAEYMEQHPLGRAEWMKFYGMLMGCGRQADSLFTRVTSEYDRLKAGAAKAATRPLVLTERIYGDTWFCPGGNSTVARMISDAHARYAFHNDSHQGSLPLSEETVISKASNADIWLFTYSGDHPLTKKELLTECRGYSQIKAFQTNGIYQCNNITSRFFDETSFRPDFLLADYVRIFHPEIFAKGRMEYYLRNNLRYYEH